MRIQLACCLLALLVYSCVKKYSGCPKEGYEYINTTSPCWYSPIDSVTLSDSIVLAASAPKAFVDEASNTKVYNKSSTLEGPLHVVMLYPVNQEAVENFRIVGEIGKAVKDSINFSGNALKGFRTIQWDESNADSFKIKIIIKPQIKGVYTIALGQQSSRDSDCALYKYFLNVGNEQNLYYLSQYINGAIGDYDSHYAFCFKVY